jgi:hypothetical protein
VIQAQVFSVSISLLSSFPNKANETQEQKTDPTSKKCVVFRKFPKFISKSAVHLSLWVLFE